MVEQDLEDLSSFIDNEWEAKSWMLATETMDLEDKVLMLKYL